MTHSYPPGQNQGGASSATLPRGGGGGGSLLRAYSPAVGSVLSTERLKSLTASGPPPSRRVPPTPSSSSSTPIGRFYSQERLHSESGYMSSPERGGSRGYPSYPSSGGSSYEDPYYAQGYGSRTGSITPVIDEEASDTEIMDDSYHIYAPRVSTLRRDFTDATQPFDATRLRVEHMERQLANLTGLVQKALTQTPVVTPRDYLSVPGPRDAYRSADRTTKRVCVSERERKKRNEETICHKSVSFEKSVSFSDEPPDMNSPKQHSPQHSADTKPAKPAIKSSTLPRTSSQERDRHKPPPPPKPMSLSPVDNRLVYRDLQLTPEMYNQLRGLQKKAKDLRQEMRNLRRMSQAQAHTIKEAIRDTFIKIRAMLLAGSDVSWAIEGDKDRLRLSREEDLYKQEMIRLEKDLTCTLQLIFCFVGCQIPLTRLVCIFQLTHQRTINIDKYLMMTYAALQEGIKGLLSTEMDKVVREEKFLKEEPERLENALRRCKKLTGTLVTLKRLASVQEQRLPSSVGDSRLSPTPAETPPTVTHPSLHHARCCLTSVIVREPVLASVQEQRLPSSVGESRLSPTPAETPPVSAVNTLPNKYAWRWSANFKQAINEYCFI
ncbi:conserved hypothetical protein [Pediculus humanus corporis]|uniref:Coiled-coil domain-containing protein AGAP005037 n=1 Tax=Pediculus humanus subsp. corporis TaxID=121224 RepID=E0VA29_PEDHC|nr:uncharacterized protein Phum_PHUM025800 [Pediculus humanus corporis]EEB10235.1 conserved hypothetical protein [Pediculus humanus corporis]